MYKLGNLGDLDIMFKGSPKFRTDEKGHEL